MDFEEEELRSRIRAGIGGTEVDLATLATGGVAKGKRLIRRRRATKAVAAGATLAVLGGVFAYADRPWQSPSSDNFAAQPASAQKVDVTPQAALKILLELLPATAKTGDYTGADFALFKPEIRSPAPSAHASYTDAVGKSNLSLSVGRFPPHDSCRLVSAHEGMTCTQTTLADGSVLTLVKNLDLDNATNLIMWSATLDRKDGVSISLTADNAEIWKERGTRPTPPLSLQQLRAIVTSPRWQLKVDADFVKQAEPLFEPRPAPTISTPPPDTSPSPRPS